MGDAGSSLLTVKLGHKILPGRVTVGCYDGRQSFLTAATYGERVKTNAEKNYLLVTCIKAAIK